MRPTPFGFHVIDLFDMDDALNVKHRDKIPDGIVSDDGVVTSDGRYAEYEKLLLELSEMKENL